MTKQADMRERCARRLWERYNQDPWEDAPFGARMNCEADVDAIFAELAEPDEAMFNAGVEVFPEDVQETAIVQYLSHAWQAMLKAAGGK